MNHRLPYPPSPHSFALAPRLLFLRHLLSALSREEYVCDLPASIGMKDLALRDHLQLLMSESSFGLIRHVMASFPVKVQPLGKTEGELLQVVIRFADGEVLYLQALDLSKSSPATHSRYLLAGKKQEQGAVTLEGLDWPYPLFSAAGSRRGRLFADRPSMRLDALISFRKSTR